jgi:hypothetical protein
MVLLKISCHLQYKSFTRVIMSCGEPGSLKGPAGILLDMCPNLRWSGAMSFSMGVLHELLFMVTPRGVEFISDSMSLRMVWSPVA